MPVSISDFGLVAEAIKRDHFEHAENPVDGYLTEGFKAKLDGDHVLLMIAKNESGQPATTMIALKKPDGETLGIATVQSANPDTVLLKYPDEISDEQAQIRESHIERWVSTLQVG